MSRLGLSLVLLALLAAPATAELRVDPEVPRVGQEVRIEAEPGLVLALIEAPQSSRARETVLADAAPDRAFRWIPERAGLVRLELRDPSGTVVATHDFAVAYDGLPLAALGVALTAGLLLFGAASWSLRRLLRAP